MIEICSLPELLFAHAYRAEGYRNRFPAETQYLEIAYVAEGIIALTAGNQTVRAEKGDVLCMLREEPLQVTAEGPHRHYTAAAAVDWRYTEDPEKGVFLPLLIPAKLNTAPVCKIIDEFVHRAQYYQTMKVNGAAKFMELICAADRCARAGREPDPGLGDKYVRAAKEYVLQHIREPITQKEIAGSLGITPEYLCAVFRKAERTTMMRYINRLKLENIRLLVEHKNMRLYEAAALYGYTDPNYASRLFKQIFGYNISARPSVHPELPAQEE